MVKVSRLLRAKQKESYEDRKLFFNHLFQSFQLNSVESRVTQSLRLFLLLATFFLFGWFVYFSFCTISIPYQIEYREGAAQVMTQILLSGGNPFSLEYQPLGMNNYGMVYNLFVLPFAALFGNTLAVHRSISVFFLFASLYLVMWVIFNLKRDLLIASLGGILIVSTLAGRGGLGAFPSSMGEFLFLAALLIPFMYAFDYPSLIASAFLSVIAYYTKPYFVISFGVVAAYMFLFNSKRKSLVYGLIFLAIFIILYVAIRYKFSFYFIDTLISNFSNQKRSLDHLRSQLVEMLVEFYPIILLGVSLLLFHKPELLQENLIRKSPRPRLNFLDFDSAFTSLRGNYFAFTFIICFLSFISILGFHKGNYMNYAYQLVIPPFVLWLFQRLNSKSLYSSLTLFLPVANILLLNSVLLNPSFLHQRDSKEWADLYNLIRNSRSVVNSPVVTSLLIETGIPPVDSGQSEYYYEIKPYPSNKLLGPDYNTVKQNGKMYLQSIRNRIKEHKFDKVIMTDGYYNLIPPGTLRQYHYHKVDTITVEMPQVYQTWVIAIWELSNE